MNRPTHLADMRLATWIDWRCGLCILTMFTLSLTVAWAQGMPARPNALATLVNWIPFILKGFLLNLGMSFAAMILATLLGILLGLMQISHLWTVRKPSWCLTHLLRNSPWIVVLFIVMLLTPSEIKLGSSTLYVAEWIKATFAFSLPVIGNISEIVRGAVRSIPTGQWESAEGLAFTRWQTLWWIILPQCVRRALPPWMNWYAMLTLSTPIASLFSIQEAVSSAQAAMESAGSRPEFLFPFYLFLVVLFFAYIYPIAVLTRRLEQKYAV